MSYCKLGKQTDVAVRSGINEMKCLFYKFAVPYEYWELTYISRVRQNSEHCNTKARDVITGSKLYSARKLKQILYSSSENINNNSLTER